MFALPARTGARAIARNVVACGAIWCAVQLVTLAIAYAQEPRLNGAPMIFDMRKSLPLEPQEPAYHDFYINAGPEAGFKKGLYVTVVRQVPVHDPVQNKQQGTLSIGVAKLQIIHVERQITVARLVTEFTDEERPTLEFEGVMIGDRIDTATLTSEAPGSAKKRKASQQNEEPASVGQQAGGDPETASPPQTAPGMVRLPAAVGIRSL